jgi:hypothetical protein
MTELRLKNLQGAAKRRLKLREDSRFKRTVEVLQRHGLIFAPHPSGAGFHGARITFEDAYFAGDLEPRVFEVLPALAYRRPKAFLDPWNMPRDLKELLEKIRLGLQLTTFHGIDPKNYMVWVKRLKRTNSKESAIRKDFRFSKEDVALLRALQNKFQLRSQTEVIRKAIRALEASVVS